MTEKDANKDIVFRTLRRSPGGMTVTELEQETRLQGRSIRNYLLELVDEGKAQRDGKYFFADLPYERLQLRPIDLSPEEAMTLYLATRLFVKQHDKRNDVAHLALLKLADALTKGAQVGDEIYQAARELSSRPDDGRYNRVFRLMMQAYIFRRKIHITYAPAETPSFDTDFEPYLIEPSAIGYATYAIGYSHRFGAVHTYKLERIQAAELLRGDENRYSVRPDFKGLDVLQSAWSIIYGEKTQPVVLRFSPAVRRRVEETRWHPSEQRGDDPDKPGHLRWTAHIAGLTDILPWVRGWGSEVEVLAPDRLRRHLKRQAARLALMYQSSLPELPAPYMHLWAKAKTNRKPPTHALIYHLIDVGQCAQALWESGLADPLKAQTAAWLGVSAEEAGRLTAFLAACHDLGKASPAFQYHPTLRGKPLGEELKLKLESRGFRFPPNPRREISRHEAITTWALDKERLLEKQAAFGPEFARKAAQMLGGHHGAWPASSVINHMHPDDTGETLPGWAEARQALVGELVTLFQPPALSRFDVSTENENALLAVLSAIVSVADWIGSDDETFEYCGDEGLIADYSTDARDQARAALSRHEWKPWPAPRRLFDFATAFEGKTPTETQTKVLEIGAGFTVPNLVILEAPMGSGKTEAALGLYALWAQGSQGRGLYVAMPTTATSNQMWGRVDKFLRWFYGDAVTPMLVHSRAAMQDARFGAGQIVEDGEGVDEDEHRSGDLSWFLPRKKSLLFPFGVGTVDQTLMSVLQTKHFFVRLLGLSHKVIIFDEIHAYDAYMNTLFKRLLEWLRELGTSVIMLSATLPEVTRRELVRAYGGEVDAMPNTAYPRLTFAADGKAQSEALPPPTERRQLGLVWIGRDETTVIARLRAELAEGGCAEVICNTVKRAQEVYQAIEQVNQAEHWVEAEDLILFHARYPLAWRDEIERNVLARFGPPDEQGCDSPERPRKAIVVATQVIEQSLDLDFDVVISDFAPADLLLQRAGRLQRHRRASRRPEHLDRLLVAAPPEANGAPQFDRADRYVYAEYVLLRSWLALKRRGNGVTLPDEVSELIEDVYGEQAHEELSEAMRQRLERAKEAMNDENATDIHKARKRLARKPDDENLLWQSAADLEEDNPEVSAVFQALTRADRPGLSLVCLHQTERGLALEPVGNETIDPYALTLEKVRALTGYAVTVNRPDVMGYFLAQDVPAAWKRNAALRYHRLALFVNGDCPLIGTGYTLKLTRKLGLAMLQEAL